MFNNPSESPSEALDPELAAQLGAAAAPTVPDEELIALADSIASDAATFVAAVESIASGAQPAAAVSVLILELSAVLMAGARLGAHQDIVPNGRYEPDAGREPDTDGLRMALAEQFNEVDEYLEVFDPYVRGDVTPALLSDDLAAISSDLLHGLAHYAAGRLVEALWWWQYSYLSSWGPSASAALRAVQSLIGHVRLGNPITPLEK